MLLAILLGEFRCPRKNRDHEIPKMHKRLICVPLSVFKAFKPFKAKPVCHKL